MPIAVRGRPPEHRWVLDTSRRVGVDLKLYSKNEVSPAEWAKTLVLATATKIDRLSGSGRSAPRALPEADAPKRRASGSRKLPQTKSQTKRRF